MDPEPVFVFKDVSFSYARGGLVFENVRLNIPRGAFVLVEGPSGSGKSTFLRLLNRLEEPSAGGICFSGRKLEEYAPPVLRRKVSLLQQTPVVVPGTVLENLLLPFSFRANKDLDVPDHELLRAMLVKFLLPDIRLDTEAKGLSVGQRQRLSLIRAMLLEPAVMLLDEPASALDPESRGVVENTLEDLNLGQGTTIVMVSHHGFRPRKAVPLRLTVNQGKIKVSA